MLAALAGGAALAGRGKGTAFPRPRAGTIDQMAADAAGTDSAVTGTEYPGADAVTKKQIIPMGAGHPIIRGNINRHKAALAAANVPGHGTAVAPPGILNPYNPRIHTARGMNRAKGGRIGAKKGGDGKWIQKVNASIKRRGTKGKCTPITKKGCTGRAKALAKTFKKMAKKRKKS